MPHYMVQYEFRKRADQCGLGVERKAESRECNPEAQL